MKPVVVIAVFVCLLGASDALDCRMRACPLDYEPVCAQKSVNGQIVKKQFSNKCMVEAANDCSNEYVTEEEALDHAGVCLLNATFKFDCNFCSCVIGKDPSCTRMLCPAGLTEEESLDENGICRVNSVFKYYCNTCSCIEGSYPGCTLMLCHLQPKWELCK